MNGLEGPRRKSSKHTDDVKVSGCLTAIVLSKSKTSLILKVDSSCQVEEYHIPPLVKSHSTFPSIGINSTLVESPGIPLSLSVSVCCAKIIICEDISLLSIEPSNSSIIGTIDTNINPIIETTPPNKSTVATAAETASSFLWVLTLIFQAPPVEYLRPKIAVHRLFVR